MTAIRVRRRKSLPLMRIAKEFVAVSAMIEIMLGSYVGVKFALGESCQAWLWLLFLGVLAYISTRIWIYYFDNRIKNG